MLPQGVVCPFLLSGGDTGTMQEFTSTGKRMTRLLAALDAVAASPSPVLIRGERGSGKEYLARKIHEKRPVHGPFVQLKCRDLDAGSLSGLEAVADGATLFLDGIHCLPSACQLPLHAFLTERIRAGKGQQDGLKVIASATGELEALSAGGTFRLELLVLLDMISVSCPPLRERQEDILPLATLFLRELAAEQNRLVQGFSPAALKKLEAYHWPGNIRELHNVIERAVLMGRGTRLEADDLDFAEGVPLSGGQGGMAVRQGASGSPAVPAGATACLELKEAVNAFKKSYIADVIAASAGNKAEAARRLGIERTYLFALIKDLGMEGL